MKSFREYINEKIDSKTKRAVEKVLRSAKLDFYDEHWDPGTWDEKWLYKGKDESKVTDKLVDIAEEAGYIYVISREEGGYLTVFGMNNE